MLENNLVKKGLAVALAMLIVACGDSGPAGGNGGGGGGDVFRPTSDVQLSGNQSFRSVEIPAGVTVRADGDLTLTASEGMRIEGSLVGDCVVLQLTAADLDLVGTVRNDCSGTLPVSPPPLIIRSSGALDVRSGLIRSSGEAAVNGATGGLNDLIPAQQEAICTIEGGTMESLPAEAAPASDGASWRVSCGGAMEFAGTTIRAQNAGAATDASGSAVVSGEPGGSGGDIHLTAEGIHFTGINVLQAGDGAAGARAEAVATEPGADAQATAGDGGAGGTIEVSSSGPVRVDGPLTLELGGGAEGGTASAQAVTGADATEDAPAQPGGDATAVAGNGGSVGAIELEAPNVTGVENVFVRAGDAGNGGVAAAQGGDGGNGSRAFPAGAAGGASEAVGGDGGASDAVDLEGAFVSEAGGGGGIVLTGSNGGDGADLCPSVDDPDATAGGGGPGGSGGRASGRDGRPGAGDVGEAEPGGATFFELATGGDGGAGSPPGSPGAAGTDATDVAGRVERGSQVFEPGIPGSPCISLLVLDETATIRLAANGDPSGIDDLIFDIPSQGQNPNQQPTGSVEHPVRILATPDRIRVEGPSPWIDVEGDLDSDGAFRAEGTGTVAGSPATAVLEGLFVNGGLSSTLTITLQGGESIRYTVTSPQVLGSKSPDVL